MKKRIYFTVALICTMLLASCKQPTNENESIEASIILEKDQIFLNPSPIMAPSSHQVIQITYSQNIDLPLTVSDYDPALMTATISDDNQTITITALEDSEQEIFIIDQSGIRSKPLSVVISSLDLELSITMPASPVKVGQKFDLPINKGSDVGILNVSSSDHLSTTLTDSTISVEALKDGLASITLTDGVVSTDIAFAVEPLDKSLSIAIPTRTVKVGQKFDLPINKGSDVGILSISSSDHLSTMLTDSTISVEALKDGLASITLTDGVVSTDIAFAVEPLDKSLSIAIPTRTVKVGQKFDLPINKGSDVGILSISSSDHLSTMLTDSTISVEALTEGLASITVTDGVVSTDIAFAVEPLDKSLSIAIPTRTVKVGQKFDLPINKGSDVGILSISSSDHLSTMLTDSTISVEALTEGLASITVTDGVVSTDIAFQIAPLDKSLSFSPQESSLKVNQSRIYTIYQGVDGGELEISYDNDAVVYVQPITQGSFNITGLKKGRATITVTDTSDPTITVTATIMVQALDQTLELDATTTTIATTKIANLTVRKGVDINSADLVIESSNESVATAQFTDNKQNVVVTGKSVGKTTISIRDPKSNASHAVEMTVRALDLRLEVENDMVLTLTDHNGVESSKATYTVTKGIDIEGPFTVSGYDPAIASISANGDKITAVAKGRGETSFIIKDKNGVESRSVKVSILDVVITVPSEKITLKVGGTKHFDISITGPDAASFAYQLLQANGTITSTGHSNKIDEEGNRVLHFTIKGLKVGRNGVYLYKVVNGQRNASSIATYNFEVIE